MSCDAICAREAREMDQSEQVSTLELRGTQPERTGRVRVGVRCRPFFDDELQTAGQEDADSCVTCSPGAQLTSLPLHPSAPVTFAALPQASVCIRRVETCCVESRPRFRFFDTPPPPAASPPAPPLRSRAPSILVFMQAPASTHRGLWTVSVRISASRSRDFVFDEAFDRTCPQDQVYNRMARPVVADVLSGFNGTVFAYGQTGTGKVEALDPFEPHACLIAPGIMRTLGSPRHFLLCMA